jgi:hypothetical protein
MLYCARSCVHNTTLPSEKTARASRHRLGRPPKFGRPSQLVALTLPTQVIRGLRKVHPDLAWAIVAQFEKRGPMTNGNPRAESELVSTGARDSFLIVINRALFKRLPGVNIVPLTADRAFLALEPGCGIVDLETAVQDRLESSAVATPERRALLHFRNQLRAWRRNRAFRFHTRTIIVVERSRSLERRSRRQF